MKKLFPIPVMGAGSADVESLSSYLVRLSEAHGLSVKLMLQHLQCWAAHHEDVVGKIVKISAQTKLLTFGRPNKLTADVLRVLTHATDVPFLRSTTLLALEKPHRRMSGYANGGFRWCPACMAQWEKNGETVYLKLAWHINDVTYCHIHNVLLRNLCPHCQQPQLSGSPKGPIHSCDRCGKSLSAKIRPAEIVSARNRTAGDLIHLVEQIALNPDLEFVKDGVHRIMTKLDREADRSEEAHRVFNSLFPVYWKQVGSNAKRLTFPQCRGFAAISGMRLYDVLMGTCVGQTRTIDYEWGIGAKNAWKAESKKRRDFDECKKTIELALKEMNGKFPSLKGFAKSTNLTVGYLHYKFPVVAERITASYQEHIAEERAKRDIKARLAIIQFIDNSKDPDDKTSKKSVLRHVQSQTGYAKNFLRRHIQEVFKSLAFPEV